MKSYEQRLQAWQFAGIFFFCVRDKFLDKKIDSSVNVNVYLVQKLKQT